MRQQSANSLSAVRSADEDRSLRNSGVFGHMQHVNENESDTRIDGKSVIAYTYCNIGGASFTVHLFFKYRL